MFQCLRPLVGGVAAGRSAQENFSGLCYHRDNPVAVLQGGGTGEGEHTTGAGGMELGVSQSQGLPTLALGLERIKPPTDGGSK